VIERGLEIALAEGVHLRVATAIVELVGQHEAKVIFTHQSQQAEGQSAIELLALGLVPGAAVDLRVEGPDEEIVMERLVALIGDGAQAL
jgi:phosphotransferase system HPr (HPr) family protein